MGESTFIKLEYEAKDKGQRIEIDIVVAAADVERAMEGFYDLMARVKQVGAPGAPGAPAAPGAPKAPGMPAAPGAPAAPGRPAAPGAPKAPGAK